MRNFPLFIARRIYGSHDGKQKASRPAINIATAGVAIGLAVMIISVAIVLGFKHTIQRKVIGFGGQIEVADFMTLQSSDQYPVVMNDSMLTVLRRIPNVAHVQRYVLKEGILKTDSDFLGVAFKGVGPEWDSTFIHQNMVAGSIPRFSDSASHNRIVISQAQADKLHLHAGDRIFAYFIDHNGVRTRRFTIAGIYQTNLKKFDESIVFTDLYTARKLNGWYDDQASGAEVMLHDFSRLDETEQYFVTLVNRTVDHYGETYASATIRDLYPQIFQWLDLMNLNVWVILGLMIAVAGVTMISGLLIIILERTTMIGILKALGARNKTIRHTFLWFAAFILLKGLVIGNAIALGLLALQRYTGFVHLDARTYYVSTVPVEFAWPYFVAINIVTILFCLLILVGPSFLISHIHPSKSMRYE
ncbi:MAG: ABC transporter permease [Prevotella sp.]|nr:ABC transporter permease [Prevotella sp.]